MKVYKITLLKKKIFIIFATNFYQLKIIRDLSTYKSPDFTAVSIGMFDGVHLGHQSVISLLKEKAKEKNTAARSAARLFGLSEKLILAELEWLNEEMGEVKK